MRAWIEYFQAKHYRGDRYIARGRLHPTADDAFWARYPHLRARLIKLAFEALRAIVAIEASSSKTLSQSEVTE